MAVCLHCLHEARVAAREHRQRVIIRAALWTLSLAIVGVVGAAGANAVVHHPEVSAGATGGRRSAPRVSASHHDTAVAVVAAAPVMQQGAPAAAAAAVVDSASRPSNAVGTIAASVAVADSTPKPAPKPAAPSLATLLPPGRTDLIDSLFAERRGDTVVVHFDTSPARTRRADKFETIVRQTLKVVYGPAADSMLAAVPVGRLTAPNELLTTLPSRGIHLTAPGGARVGIWPETRQGRDGLLAVAYRTTVER